MLTKRTSGILMPITSLPSPEGIGTLGKGAYKFIDFLKKSNAKIWQILPLNPTGFGNSPYQSCSSNALNYFLIDLSILRDEGLLTEQEIQSSDLKSNDLYVDYSKQFTNKIALLKKAFSRFDIKNAEFLKFIDDGEFFDFAIFMSLKQKFNFVPWTEWEEPYKTYNPDYIKFYIKENPSKFLFWQFTQYKFLEQWNELKRYAKKSGIKIMGDIPLYLSHDSVEMWKYGSALFKVDEYKVPTSVAGAPPDAFSQEGQLWGNPLYDWEKLKNDGYKWWNERIFSAFKLYDILRIDHFRGFDRYYSVPANSENAKCGVWEEGPKEELFADKLQLDIVAEDLGVLDEGVYRLMKNTGYAGMKILQFAFDGDENNAHKPSNITPNFVCYTGTHDNMPLTQYIKDLSESEYKTYCADVIQESGKLGVKCDVSSAENICKTVIRLAYKCAANTVIIPMWDILCLDAKARINLPATVSINNWSWRAQNEHFSPHIAESIKQYVKIGQRC